VLDRDGFSGGTGEAQEPPTASAPMEPFLNFVDMEESKEGL
jgi:hypothetical protein